MRKSVINESNKKTLADTGANTHINPPSSKSKLAKKNVGFAKVQIKPAAGLPTGGKFSHEVLGTAVDMPNCPYALISPGQLYHDGWNVRWSRKSTAMEADKGKHHLRFELKRDNLFHLAKEDSTALMSIYGNNEFD